MMTLSYPNFLGFAALEAEFSWCSKVNTDPVIKGCPNLFPKSEAPLDALIRISIGV